MANVCPPNCIKGTPLWSLYDITDTNPEFCLFESIIGEYTDISGFPVLYYRAKSKMDRLYGEDSNQDFYEPVETKLSYEPTEEPNIIDGLGLRSDETLQYSLIPKANFTRDIFGGVEYEMGVPVNLGNITGGSGYSQGTGVTTTSLNGTGLIVSVKTNSSGEVIYVQIENAGSGYFKDDVVTVNGGDNNATFTVESITKRPFQPMPGDVVKTLWNNRNYEIVDIGAEQSIFMAKKLIWEFILRPYRFSEQSSAAVAIHRSAAQLLHIYVHPDGATVDLMYEDGTEATGLDISVLGTLTPPVEINMDALACDAVYTVNADGSIETTTQTVVEEDADPLEGEYQETGAPLKDGSSKKYGDDTWVEIESDEIDDYGDVDTKIFGY
jgi:hypothetical protein